MMGEMGEGEREIEGWTAGHNDTSGCRRFRNSFVIPEFKDYI